MRYFVEGTTMTGIADAIRYKTGDPELIPTVKMANQIRSIGNNRYIDILEVSNINLPRTIIGNAIMEVSE